MDCAEDVRYKRKKAVVKMTVTGVDEMLPRPRLTVGLTAPHISWDGVNTAGRTAMGYI